MAIKQEIKQKLEGLGYNRKVTNEDVTNVRKHGLGYLKNTFGVNQGVPTNTNKTDGMGVAEAGQAATTPPQISAVPPSLEQLKAREQEQIQQETKLSDQGTMAADIMGRLLEAKQKALPYDRKIAQVQERVLATTFNDYIKRGLSEEQALSSMQEDLARAQSQISFYDTKKEETATAADQLLNSYIESQNQRLAAIGLQIGRTQQQIATAESEQANAINLAFQPSTLLAGVMPPGLPESYKATWEAQSAEAKRQLALQESLAQRSGRGGGGGMPQSEKDDRAFRDAAANAILQLDAGEISWGSAWDAIHAMHPTKSNAEIDSILGGGYDESKGGWWGRAANSSAGMY